jgi:hypothetical protein
VRSPARLVKLFAGVVIAGGGSLSGGAASQPAIAQGQAQLEKLVRESTDASAARARDWLGNMHPEAQLAFRKWTLAVQSWQKEETAGPEATLAEGVLFDCLGRTTYLYTRFTSGPAVDRRFQNLGTADRLGRAATLFEKSLKADPSLLEARFRALRIRALTDSKAALELERLATSQMDAEVSYLAAVSRAVIASGRGDTPTAIRWYEYALTLHTRSTAATVGLSALRPEEPLHFESLDSNDPYYNYPCRILTPSVATQLAERLAKLPAK